MATDTPIIVKITVDSTQLDGAVAKVNDNLKSFSTTANTTAGALGLHSKSATEAAAATHNLSFETAAAKREVLVLAHELSQGNFKRFGGSLLVLAEQTGAAGLLLNPVTLTLGAIAVAAGAFAIQAHEGAQQSAALAGAMRVTGNYAGVTEGQFNALVKSVSASSGATLAASRDIAQAIVSTGEFGPRVLGTATEAAARYAKATGLSGEEVAKDFAKMGDGVARYALEHNKSFNFLTTTQYAYIKSLEDQGRTEEAELVTLRALSDHFGGPLVQNLGTLEQTLNSVKGAWDRFWNAAKASGRTQTVDDRIAAIDEKLRKFNETRGSAARPGEGYTPTAGGEPPLSANNAAALLAERAQLITESGQGALRAFDVASTARVHKLGVEAKAYLDAIDDEAKGTTRLKRALDELHRKQDSVRADGQVLTPAQLAAEEAVIRRKFSESKGPSGSAKAAAEAKALGEAKLAVQKAYASLSEQVAQEAIAVELRANDLLYQTGRVNLVAYYNTKANLERQSIANQQKMLQADYAATVVEAASLSKSADKLKNQAKQVELVGKLAVLEGKKALVAGSEDAAAPIAYQTGRGLRDSTAKLNAELIRDDHIKAQALLDIEIGLQREKLDEQLQGSARYQEILDQFNAYTVLRQEQLVEDLKPQWQKMLEGFQDTVQYMRKAGDDFNAGFVNGGRDAFTAFVTTGKFSVGNLVQFIEQQFAKMAYDRYLAKSVSDLGSSLFDGADSLISLIGGLAVGAGVNPRLFAGEDADFCECRS